MKKNFDDKCGEPAFDNIEEILAEKIVNHSKNHCTFSEGEKRPKEEHLPPKKCMFDNKRMLLLLIVISLMLLVIPLIIGMKVLNLFKFNLPQKK